MKTPTNVQIIKQGDKPAFAVLPYDQYLQLIGNEADETYIPHEVVKLCIVKNISLIAAWRTHKGYNQTKLAKLIDVSQSAIAQIEKLGSKPHAQTLAKIANALNVDIEQLTDD